MKTPRIEEMATKLVTDIFGVELGGSEYDVAVKALTEAHQAGRDEAVEMLESMKFRHKKGGCYNCNCRIYDKALDDTIEALQDNK